MYYEAKLRGDSPVIHHSAAGLDSTTPIAREIQEIAKKRGTNRTIADELRLKELECKRGLWTVGDDEIPTIPVSAIRACIETSARKLKQGALVREGLIVTDTSFHYDVNRYGKTLDEIAVKAQFTVPVVVQRNRILRTRARFETPWSVTAKIMLDEELADRDMLENWLAIGGSRIGLGDWRPEKSGMHGRFSVESVTEVDA